MGILRDKRFLIGVAVGTIVGPVILAKVSPSLKSKLPAQ